MKKQIAFREKGQSASDLRAVLDGHKSGDAPWKDGKTFGFIYHPGDPYAGLSECYQDTFRYESTLNPSAFPSLRKFEKDIICMGRELLHGDAQVAGNITTGGTESIFLALKVARDLAFERRGGNASFQVILPVTAHPAFLKACHYLMLDPVIIPIADDGRVDVEAMEAAIGPETIMLVASAPCFPNGTVDPVAALGELAEKHKLLLHVDACMGGFILPFLEELGHPVPMFDFRIPGVSSISLDAHKYGYAPKGVSLLLHRRRENRRKQFFVHTEWPGGIFASTTFMGTRSGGPLAGCWAIMQHLGREGYRELARKVMETTEQIRRGIEAMDGLQVLHDPVMSVMAFTSDQGNIYNIGDALAEKGWYLDRLQFPEALHLTITRLNVDMGEAFLHDLEAVLSAEPALARAKNRTRSSVRLAGALSHILPHSLVDWAARYVGSILGDSETQSASDAALYGISAKLGKRENVHRMVENLLDGMY